MVMISAYFRIYAVGDFALSVETHMGEKAENVPMLRTASFGSDVRMLKSLGRKQLVIKSGLVLENGVESAKPVNRVFEAVAEEGDTDGTSRLSRRLSPMRTPVTENDPLGLFCNPPQMVHPASPPKPVSLASSPPQNLINFEPFSSDEFRTSDTKRASEPKLVESPGSVDQLKDGSLSQTDRQVSLGSMLSQEDSIASQEDTGSTASSLRGTLERSPSVESNTDPAIRRRSLNLDIDKLKSRLKSPQKSDSLPLASSPLSDKSLKKDDPLAGSTWKESLSSVSGALKSAARSAGGLRLASKWSEFKQSVGSVSSTLSTPTKAAAASALHQSKSALFSLGMGLDSEVRPLDDEIDGEERLPGTYRVLGITGEVA